MPYKDIEKKREFQRRWIKEKRARADKPIWQVERKRRRAVYQRYYDLKRSKSCKRCGYDHPAALTFHHTDPENKTRAVAEMVGHGYTWEQVLREIDKCEVLCCNCHAVEHWGEGYETS